MLNGYCSVAEMIDQLDADLREDFEERAGILEHDAKEIRRHAECLALLDVLRRNPSALTRVTVLTVELEGATQWLLTTDLGFARQHLSEIGGIEIVVCDLAEVIEQQYGGLSMLATF